MCDYLYMKYYDSCDTINLKKNENKKQNENRFIYSNCKLNRNANKKTDSIIKST